MLETTSDRGMVVAPHAAAAEAGAAVLREGGTAIEAMIAAAATIAVVYPHMNSIGGDGFWLIAEPGRPPRAIEACGRAGSRATIARYNDAGFDRVPARGPWAANTVAGTIAGWQLALALAASLGGRMRLADLLSDAVRHAREGIEAAGSLCRSLDACAGELRDMPGFADLFLPGGKPLAPGARLRQERLADVLDHLAHEGLQEFYRGDVGVEIAKDLDAVGAPLTRSDLERCEACLVEPLTVRVRAGTLFNLPPPTQGLASLMILGLYDRIAAAQPESFDHAHRLIEASKRAYAVRDLVVCDPDRQRIEPASLLEPARLAREAAAIDLGRASEHAAPVEAGDTVYMAAIDRNGLAVSFIQSVFWAFGAGLVLPGTGIVWQNRGSAFSLEPGHPNALEPGIRPFHTLNPALARLADGRVMVYGTMGGDAQALIQAQVFTRHVMHGVDLADALDRPRFVLDRADADATIVKVESRFDADILYALERAGHRIEVLDAAYADMMGHAGAIVRRPDGTMTGAADPRSDGAARAG